MSYIRLSDLRGEDRDILRTDPRTPDEMERAADEMLREARELRDKSIGADPAAPIYAARATQLEVSARHLRQVAGTKRSFDGMGDVTSTPDQSAPASSWRLPVAGGLALVGLAGLALYWRSRHSA